MSENVQATPSPRAAAGEKPSGGKLTVQFGGPKMKVAIVVAALVTALGVALWVYQLNAGMVNTNMRNLDSWGLYITMFMFFVGLSAGGLIISSVPRAFGMEGFGGISKVAVWTSICSTVCAIAFVVVDMGQPLRVWELFVYSNLTSPLMWDIIVLSTYLILSCVYLWATLRAEAGRVSARALRVISVIALVCAVLVHSVTAWIFGLQASHEFWHTALLGPWFVCSALVCGTALVLAASVALRAAGYLSLEQRYVAKLARLLGVFVCVELYFFGCDLLTSGFPGGEGAEVVSMLVSGQLAPYFWGEVACLAVAAALCFVPALRTTRGAVAAAALAMAGIFLKRFQLLAGGFQISGLDGLAGVSTAHTVTAWEAGTSAAYQGLIYWPTMLELGVALGVLGLGALLLLLGLRYLPLRPSGEKH